MRAVYVAIVLGFLRRLLRRVMSPAGKPSGKHWEMCGPSYDVWLVMESGAGLRYYVGGPWTVDLPGECRMDKIAGAWTAELPGELVLSATHVDSGRMPGIDTYLKTHTDEYTVVHQVVSGCLSEIIREFS